LYTRLRKKEKESKIYTMQLVFFKIKLDYFLLLQTEVGFIDTPKSSAAN
jgi:hypothetical protein